MNNFSYKQLYKLSAIFLLIILTLKIWPPAIFLVGIILFYTLTTGKMEHTFGVLMLLLALSVMNTALVDKGFSFYLVTRGSIFVLAVVVSMKSSAVRNAWFLSPFYILIAYVIYMMAVSFAGWAPVISELKAVLFLVFILAFIQIVSAVNLKQVDISFVRTTMLVIAGFYILGSIAVIPFPAIGQSMMIQKLAVWGEEFVASDVESISMFNGLAWHSQTLGPLIAVLNAFLLTDYLCSFKKKNWLYRILLLAAPVLIYKSSSRTAFFAYAISILASIFFYMRERGLPVKKKQTVLFNFFITMFIGLIFLAVHPSSRQSIESFLRKSGDTSEIASSESLTESLTKSRMGLVEEGMANFRKSPLIGNGFQVSEDMKYVNKNELTTFLSAPIEKGVLPVMVLEEGGVIGAMILLAFVIAVYTRYSKLNLNCFLATFTVFIALNTGEASFFSTSGTGGILWAICFSALVLDVDRHRRSLAMRQMQFAGVGVAQGRPR